LCDSAKLNENDKGNRSLIWRSFLVAPLLSKGDGEEVKFSGNTDFKPNGDALGDVMDAFTHHAFLDSGETFLPADLQGKYFQVFVA
jgi:hypothetical protein